jgi:hypothetical protein
MARRKKLSTIPCGRIAALADTDRLPSGVQRSVAALDNDPEERIFIQRLAAPHVVDWTQVTRPGKLTAGSHTVDFGTKHWRVYWPLPHIG